MSCIENGLQHQASAVRLNMEVMTSGRVPFDEFCGSGGWVKRLSRSTTLLEAWSPGDGIVQPIKSGDYRDETGRLYRVIS